MPGETVCEVIDRFMAQVFKITAERRKTIEERIETLAAADAGIKCVSRCAEEFRIAGAAARALRRG